MKLIDREGRLFGKVSIIDVLVLAAVAVLAVALNFKNNQTLTGTSVTQQPITFQIAVRGVRNYMQYNIQVGDLVYEKNVSSGGALGEIVDIQVSEGATMGPIDLDGSYEFIPIDDSCNLLLTVQGQGLIEGRQYYLNRIYSIGVHSSRLFYTKYAEFQGEVWSIQ